MTTKTTPSSYLILPLWILAAVMLCAMAQEAASIILWVACSFFLVALLDPASQFLRRYMPKSLSALLVVAAATIIAIMFFYVLVHFSAQMVADLESSKKMFMHYYHSVRSTWESWMQVFAPTSGHEAHGAHQVAQHVDASAAAGADSAAAGAKTGASSGASSVASSGASAPQPTPLPAAAPPTQQPSSSGGAPSFSGDMASTLARGLGSFVNILVYAFLIPVLTFFMLSERDHFGGVIQKAMDKPEQGPKMWIRMVEATRAYFFGNLVLGIVSFPILTGLFFAFGVPSPFTLAALASVFNLVPFLGAVLSGLLPAVALLSSGAHGGTVLALYALCAVFHMILANFVTPKVLGQRLNVNATTSTLALVICGELLGGVGLLLAIPFVAVVKIMFETSDLWWLNWMAWVMDERPKKSQ